MTDPITTWHPILFSGPMICAILSGSKTQTRRVIVPQPKYEATGHSWNAEPGDAVIWHGRPHILRESKGRNKRAAGELTPAECRCPYGKPGDGLWVQEGFLTAECNAETVSVHYKADYAWRHGLTVPETHKDMPTAQPGGRWHSGRFMPRWACRLFRITDVRVQRVQEISEEDAVAEGFLYRSWESAKHDECCNAEEYAANVFSGGWDSINAKRGFGWDANPWTWAISFEVIDHA